MKNEKMNIYNLKINNFIIPTNELHKIKGGLGDPPPIGAVTITIGTVKK